MSETVSAPATSTADAGSTESTGSETGSNQVTAQGEREQTVSKSETPTQSTKKKFTYKVDGEDVEEEIDLSDEEGLVKRLRLSRAAEKRMSEAKLVKTQAFEIIKAFESGDEKFFEKMGPKGREMAEKILLKHIQAEMETPEQKKAREEREELEILRNEKKMSKEQAEKQALEARTQKYAQDFQSTIIGALEKSGLPREPEAVKRMAGLLKKNLDLGLDLTADELAVEYKNEVTRIIQALTGAADGDQLLALFGDEVANKIRKSDLKKLQEKHSQVFQSKAPAGSSNPPKQDRPMTMEEWKEQLAQRFK